MSIQVNFIPRARYTDAEALAAAVAGKASIYTDAEAIAAVESDLGEVLTGVGEKLPVKTTVNKGANEGIINSAVMQNDDALVLSLLANTRYTFTLVCRAIADNATPDMDIGWSLPAGATMGWGDEGHGLTSLNESSEPTLPCTAVEEVYTFTGFINVSSTAGNMQLQWAQNIATVGVQTTMQINSSLTLFRLPS